MCVEAEIELNPRTEILRASHKKLLRVTEQVSRVIYGLDEVSSIGGTYETILLSLLTGGHALVQGKPGLAKTKLMESVAATLDLSYGFIQGNVGLVPDDFVGNYLRAPQGENADATGGMKFYRGPLLTSQVFLWDEVNRTAMRTQGIVLRVLQEGKYNTPQFGEVIEVPRAFFVLGVQNPNEKAAGTVPLADAVKDRFMLMADLRSPSKQTVRKMIGRMDIEPKVSDLEKVLTEGDILEMRNQIKELWPASENGRVEEYCGELVAASDPETLTEKTRILIPHGPEPRIYEDYENVVDEGAGARGAKHLFAAARAHAFLHGHDLCLSDVKVVAPRVLSHRISIRPRFINLGLKPSHVVDHLIRTVKLP